ncbi:MAG: transporter [Rhodocyclaceae bacterium]|nr:transporter [Rhodocyclaceae bacterium]
MSSDAVFRACLAAAVLAAGLVAPAEAAHPLLTEDTGTQGQGHFQLELMVDKTRDRTSGIGTRALQTAAVLSYGLREDIDLQLGQPWLRQQVRDALGRRRDSGGVDTSLDLKWRFFERDALSLAAKPGITLPTGNEDRGFGSGRLAWGSLLVLSYAPGSWALHSHLGYRRNGNSLGERRDLWHVSAAATYQASERLRLVADLSADSDPARGRRGTLRYRILGLIWSPLPALDIDAGIKHGHGEAATDRAVLGGLTFRW